MGQLQSPTVPTLPNPSARRQKAATSSTAASFQAIPRGAEVFSTWQRPLFARARSKVHLKSERRFMRAPGRGFPRSIRRTHGAWVDATRAQRRRHPRRRGRRLLTRGSARRLRGRRAPVNVARGASGGMSARPADGGEPPPQSTHVHEAMVYRQGRPHAHGAVVHGRRHLPRPHGRERPHEGRWSSRDEDAEAVQGARRPHQDAAVVRGGADEPVRGLGHGAHHPHRRRVAVGGEARQAGEHRRVAGLQRPELHGALGRARGDDGQG